MLLLILLIVTMYRNQTQIPGIGNMLDSILDSIGTHISRISPPKNISSKYLLKN